MYVLSGEYNIFPALCSALCPRTTSYKKQKCAGISFQGQNRTLAGTKFRNFVPSSSLARGKMQSAA